MTYAGNPRADQCVAGQVGALTRALVNSACPASSVYLSGSFGRGEGSAVSWGGHWRPLGDFDFYVVAPARLSADELELRLVELWERQFGGPGPSFGITVEVSRESALAGLPPDTSTYEFRHLAHLLWGREVRSRIAFGPRSIPVLSGIRGLLNKLVGLLTHAPWANAFSAVDLEYEVWKLYLDAVAALLLTEGRYAAGYRTRGRIFRTLAHRWEQVRVPALCEKADWALERKLRPVFSSSDSEDLWRQSREDLLGLLVHTTGLGDVEEPYQAIPRLVTWLRDNYYEAWARALANQRVGRAPSSLLRLLSALARRKEARRFGAPVDSHVPAALYGAAAWCVCGRAERARAEAVRLLRTVGIGVKGGEPELRRAVLRGFRRYRLAKGPKRGLTW